ncbi:ALS2 C-terminal-like protein [Myotis lucifugus]|uniref:ALS2 C-terminal-like protein n=1 Tax=Myotis lucifugus TaxID=59463 RepID=UPI000CCC4523|nr:ALS2 C-terminal-like protein [Myotis lucifugus]
MPASLSGFQGKLTSYGFTLEGSFGSGAQRGLYTQGVLDMATVPPDPSSTCKRQLGLGAFPVESRWQGVYGPFRDFVRAGCPGDLQEALLGFHVQSLRESQEYLCCERTPLDDSVGRMEGFLEEVAQHWEPEVLQQCLEMLIGEAATALQEPWERGSHWGTSLSPGSTEHEAGRTVLEGPLRLCQSLSTRGLVGFR